MPHTLTPPRRATPAAVLTAVAVLVGAAPVFAQADASPAGSSSEPVAPPSGFAWAPMSLPDGVNTKLPISWFTSIPGERTIVVAAQQAPGSSELTDAAAWTSPDLATWTESPADGIPHLGPAVVGPSGLAMLSRSERCDRTCAPVIHTSPDGTSWTEVVLPKKVRDGMHEAFQLAASPDGFVIAGKRLVIKERRRRTDFLYTPAIWTSADGVTWTISVIEDDPGGFAEATAVAAAPDGTIIAAGTDASNETRLWRRDPGGAWMAVSLPASDAPLPLTVLRLGHAAGRFYLAHTVGGLHVWTLLDGNTWEQEVVGEGPGLVLPFADQVVQLSAAEEGGSVTVRLSPDWETWTEIPAPELDGLNAYPIGRTHDGKLVVRAFKGEEPSQLWLGTPIP